MKTDWRLVVLAFAAIAAVSGCSRSADTPTSPTENAGQSSSALAALADPEVAIFNVTGADTSSGGRGPCEFNQATGQFVCPDQTRDGITFTMRFTLYDAGGNVLSAFDRTRVASIKTETTASGTTARSGASVTINRSGVMVTSGLGPGSTTHTLNGSEHGTVASTMTTADGTRFTTNSTINDSTASLVVPVRNSRDDHAYPLSGVRVHATETTTTRGSTSRTVTTRRQETFNGTNIVQVELTINGVTQHCTFDLAAKTSTCHDAGRR